jgi:CheY-like chemotaxis protein/nitrogen-specific signal transduction histidine kinase
VFYWRWFAKLTARSREPKLQQTADERPAAEPANHAHSQFLANISHEMRTPLTAILGFAEALLEPDLDPAERLAAIHTIRANGEHLLGLMNDILDVAKIEAGKMTCERIVCDPRRLITEVETLFRPRAVAQGLELSIEYQSAPPATIVTDPTRLRQILTNLLSNAVKFTARGRVRVMIAAARDGDGSPLLRFDVIDTGIGIAAEQAAALFVPFTQADPSTTRQFGGSGLGLSISRELARMLGGDVVLVTSRIGHGSHFRATVASGPLSDVSAPDQNATPAGALDAAEDVRLPPGCRLLLAEDGVDNRRLLLFILGKAGANVTQVDNGQAAVDEARRAAAAGRPYDCILMDMQMPVLDGYAASRALRSGGYRGAIIALTAHAMTGDRQRCLDAGCDEYATKPIDRRQLVQLVAKYCNHRPGGPAATTGLAPVER